MYKLLFIFLLSCISLPTTAMTQDFSSLGIPAITGTGLNSGEIEYSLSLQILALMTAITLIPSSGVGNDVVHTYYHCAFYTSAGPGNSTNTTKPGTDCDSSIFIFL